MYDYYDLEDRKMRGLRDWRSALRTPVTYRVGNAVRVQPQFVILSTLIGIFLVILFYYNWWVNYHHSDDTWSNAIRDYNYTYPLTPPVTTANTVTYKIGIVADLDTKSKSSKPNTFISYFKKGYLTYNPTQNNVKVIWDNQPATVLSSTFSQKGRGMELSELIVYDGRLLTFDDRSGMVFEIINNKVVPWVVLADGNGKEEKGFKSEWATIKDNILYVGSMGKEWTTPSGIFENYDPMWLKAINMKGEVQHLNWVNQYKKVRRALGIQFPAYLIHEAAVWGEYASQWYFLPRRCSGSPYNETVDELMGCNFLIIGDSEFSDFTALKVSEPQPKFGYSSFKFIPGTNEEAIVALKTTEFKGETATYITAFKLDGTVLLEDTLIENLKYEGIEFI